MVGPRPANSPLPSMSIWLKSMPRASKFRYFLQGFKTVIRLGIVGTNYGRTVQLPAFRADPRCQVVALAGRDAARTAELAREAGVAKGYGDWRALVEDPGRASGRHRHAAEPASADRDPRARTRQAGVRRKADGQRSRQPRAPCCGRRRSSRLPTMIDFNFHQIMSWQRAKAMLDAGAIGALRHVTVHWHVESRALQMRMRNWKTVGDDGGGVLGNFISHCFHYLEWFCGPIAGLSARVVGLAGRQRPGDHGGDGDARSSRARWCSLSMSCASYLGIGHRIEFFGEDGTLVLHNPGRRLHARLRIVSRQAAGGVARAHRRRRSGSTRNIPTAASRRCRGWPRYFSTPSKTAARPRPDLPKAIACSS